MLDWPLQSRKKGGFPGGSPVKNQPAMQGPLLIGICVLFFFALSFLALQMNATITILECIIFGNLNLQDGLPTWHCW